MLALTRKVCIVGDFAVGKTSVTERFVNNQFSEKYLTTVGVKIDTKDITLADENASIKLIIWDVAGADKFGSRELAYLRGAAGLVYVADGTREHTLQSVCDLKRQIEERYERQPSVLLLNKNDMSGLWQLTDERIATLARDFDHTFRTSAKSGEDVELAFTMLARSIIAGDIDRPQ